jgi:hypothetical protein
MHAADDDATLHGTELSLSVNYPSPCLAEPIELGSYIAIRRFVRALSLPSGERGLITVTTIAAAAVLAIVLLALLLTALYGCGNPNAAMLARSAQTPAISRTDDPPELISGAPLRIVVFEDETGSRLETRTPQLTPEQLRRLIALCEAHAGEIGFGVIRDESNNLFERLTIDPPPPPPTAQVATGTNGIDLEAKQAELDGAYNRDVVTYNADIKKWKGNVADHEKMFVSNVSRLLAQPPDAQRTDVNGGIGRAELFLSENEAVFGKPAHRYLVMISDGQDNIHKPKTALPPNTTLIIVNGVGSVGSLADLHPLRFESIDAALNYIAAKEAAPATR